MKMRISSPFQWPSYWEYAPPPPHILVFRTCKPTPLDFPYWVVAPTPHKWMALHREDSGLYFRALNMILPYHGMIPYASFTTKAGPL